MRDEGQGRIQYELARYLARKGYVINLFAIEAESDIVDLNNVSFYRIPIPNLPHIIKDLFFMLLINIKLSGKSYDVLHITGTVILHPYHINNCQFCHSAWKKIEKSVCYEPGVKGLYHRFFTSINSNLEKVVYGKHGIITAASNKIRNELIKYLDVDKEKIHIVYNGVNTDEFTATGRDMCRKRLLDELGFSNEDILVLFIGDLRVKRKGAEFLLEAFRKIKDERIKLLLIGPQRGRHYVRYIKRYGLQKRVIPMGFRKDTAALYRASDIFVFPSLYEACSIAVLEAMASGLPCIVSKETGTAEVMENGVDGIILKNPKNAVEISQKIKILAENYEIRKRIGENARKKALQYRWERMGLEYEKLLLSYAK
ncbi:glycosyltransferase family 4 protein [candidate division WOR-3 bacterium]|nr:glycosyltransferase family 4 protein [candidate division WOR-3 bacterium]